MSCMYCQAGCGRLVDTDDEPESFDNDADKCLCSWCREAFVGEDGHYSDPEETS